PRSAIAMPHWRREGPRWTKRPARAFSIGMKRSVRAFNWNRHDYRSLRQPRTEPDGRFAGPVRCDGQAEIAGQDRPHPDQDHSRREAQETRLDPSEGRTAT